MGDESATAYGSTNGPAQALHDVFDVGEFTILLRWDGRELIVTSTSDIDAAFQAGPPLPGVVLYQPRHLFVLPDALGDRCSQGDGIVTLDLGNDTSATMTDLEAVALVPGAVYGRLADGDPDARTVVDRLEAVANGGHPGAGLSHGYRLFSHVGWWSHVAWWGDVSDAGNSGRTEPDNFPDVRPPGSSSPAFGLIDVGVDTDHVWLQTNVVGKKPMGNAESDSHGTQVAGVLRQASSGSTIYAERIQHQAHAVQVQKIAAALGELAGNAAVGVVVMSFGGETKSKWDPLGDAIKTYIENAGGPERTVFAAAGNLFDPDDESPSADPITRRVVYPAAFPKVRAVAGGPTTQKFPKDGGPLPDSGQYYDWSNGGTWVTDIISVSDTERPDGYLFTSYLTKPAGSSGPPDPDNFAEARGTSLLVPIAAAMDAGANNPFPDNV